MRRGTMRIVALIAGLALPLTTGCREGAGDGSPLGAAPPAVLAAGSTLTVRLGSTVNSETARVGDHWSGVTVGTVRSGDREIIPPGSPVRGIVTGAMEARRGSRAMLDITVEEVSIGGRTHRLVAGSEPVIAGSTRARNLGAIAGGAAAGALIGKAVGGDGKDAAIGGLVGGAAATGLVAASKGYQVILKPGTVMTFTVREPVAMR